jgi:hypothetical protein
MGILYINAKEKLNVVSSWYQKPGGTIIHLTRDGNYVYGNGKPVNAKAHFSFMSGKSRDDAVAWFIKKYGDVKTTDTGDETHAEAITMPTEPDLDAEAAAIPDEVE